MLGSCWWDVETLLISSNNFKQLHTQETYKAIYLEEVEKSEGNNFLINIASDNEFKYLLLAKGGHCDPEPDLKS